MELGNILVPISMILVLIIIVVLIIVIFVYRKLNVIEQFFNKKVMTPQEKEKAEDDMTNNILKYIPFQAPPKPPPPPPSSKLPLVVEEVEKTISEDEESVESETE